MQRYSREAHLTGEWDLVFRTGKRPLHVLYLDVECHSPVVSVGPDGMTRTHQRDGSYYNHSESDHDLFLIPKIHDSWYLLKITDDGRIDAAPYASEARARRYHPDGIIVNFADAFREQLMNVPRGTKPEEELV
jgi:hypothetical protein